jgi:hypothetical protein
VAATHLEIGHLAMQRRSMKELGVGTNHLLLIWLLQQATGGSVGARQAHDDFPQIVQNPHAILERFGRITGVYGEIT